MDNLTHSLVGLAAAKAGLERKSVYATVVCVVAANLPDIDIITLAGGPSAYLANHRGITHSIVGTLALGLAFPLLFFYAERFVAKLRGREPRASLKGLLICSLLLSASHPLLDLMNNYGLRPFLPWDGRWFYGDILFIADPWIWLMLGGACFLLTAKTKMRAAMWAALAFVLTLFLLSSTRRFGPGTPSAVYVVWFAGLAVILVLHGMKVTERWGALIATAALMLVVAYCVALAFAHARALDESKVAAGNLTQGNEKVLRVAAMPTAADPLAWRSVAETDRSTFRFDLSLGARGSESSRNLFRVEKPEGDERELVTRAASNEQARVLLGFARFPVASVRRNDSGLMVVDFADLRFTEPGTHQRVGSFSLEVEVPPDH